MAILFFWRGDHYRDDTDRGRPNGPLTLQQNAKAFAKGLAGIRGIRIDADRVVTNIVSFEVDSAWMEPASFVKACAEQGLRISRYLGNSPRLRAVTHYGFETKDVEDALAVVASVLSQARAPVAAAD